MTRDEIKKALRVGGADMSNPQHRMDAALLSIMEKQDAGVSTVETKKPGSNK